MSATRSKTLASPPQSPIDIPAPPAQDAAQSEAKFSFGSFVGGCHVRRALSAITESQFAPTRVLDFLRAHPIDSSTLARYLFFSGSHYTRNLIFKCALFEVIAICWEVG
jgi:hypothetical protein